MKRLRNITAAAVALLLASATVAPAVADDDPVEESPRIVLVLDASGSMNGPDPSGVSKLEAAKKALTGALGSLPEGAHVGLRVYGATVDGPGRTPEECADTQLVHPITPLDVAGLTTAIESFEAVGETPIAYSLQEAAKDLGSEGKRHIILVSDGEERCVPDPCVAVQEIVDAGIGLQIDTVGFGVDDKARGQLSCIAEAGGGTYYDAVDAGGLASSLTKLTTRTARPFTVLGTPVEGTPTPETAPVLTVGQYVDTIASSTQGTVSKFYRIKRTQPGSTLRVNMLGRVAPSFMMDIGMRWELTTLDGKRCSHPWQSADDSRGIGRVLTGTATAFSLDPRVSDPSDSAVACDEADEFIFEATTNKGRTAFETDVEIRVMEEPAATNVADLPPGINKVPGASDEADSPASGTPVAVMGGASFNDATPLEAGTYEMDLVAGEMAFFAVPLQWGQSAVFAMDGPDPDSPGVQPMVHWDKLTVAADVYAPDFSKVTQSMTTYMMHGNGGFKGMSREQARAVPEIRYRNRWDSPEMYYVSRGFALAGDYVLALALSDSESRRGLPVTVRFSIGIDGEVSGVPEYAPPVNISHETASPEPEESPEASTETEETEPVVSPTPEASPTVVEDAVIDAEPPADGSPLPWIGGALVAVGVLGAGTWAVLRRRS